MSKCINIGTIVICSVFALSGCTSTERGAVIGGASGTIIGGVVTGKASGAVIGAGAGAIAGALIGRSKRRGYCRYRNSRGRDYEARCR